MINVLMSLLGLAIAAAIVLLVRRDKLHVKYGFTWLFAAAGFALLGLAPKATDVVASYLDISYPPALAFSFAILVLVVKALIIDIDRAKTEVRIQRLIQRVAMLEASLEEKKH